MYHLFGIRHHGPGSARMLIAELERLQPDCLLIEGPPDAEPLLEFAADAIMEPPVALLVYARDTTKYAAFFPLTVFSPEWQALKFGLRQSIPVRFMDLPHRYQLAADLERDKNAQATNTPTPVALPKLEPPVSPLPTAIFPANVNDPNPAPGDIEPIQQQPQVPNAGLGLTQDPLDWMAKAAGWSDGEEWWERLVEERSDSTGIFQAIQEAMVTLRQEVPPVLSQQAALREQQREAYMRETMRKASKDGFQRIAVVCGAWHIPALVELPPAAQDRGILKNLPKIPVEVTWSPWTYGRIASDSGYGAGVSSPGYYEHLWQQAENHTHTQAVGWLTRVARLLRAEHIDCSSAHIIEAVRLAEALASFRDRPKPGLGELNEAVQTVISMGDDTHIRLIQRKLLIGERLGRVPDAVPAVPLAKDLARQQTRLRLKPDPSQRVLDLDLRKPTDLERSHLLHRLRLLHTNWGEPSNAARGAKGTFHEIWTLQWNPEFAVQLIEAAIWGNTVESAAASFALEQAAKSTELSEITKLVHAVLEANLAIAIPGVVAKLESLAATTGAVSQLMAAVPSLAKAFRYGSVRDINASQLRHVLDGMIERICIGLPGVCVSLDDDAAQTMHQHLLSVHQSIQLLEDPAHITTWQQTLILLADRDDLHGLIAGAAARRLLDDQVESTDRAQVRLGLALSPGVEPTVTAAWLHGFLQGSGMVLLHDDRLWNALDNWLTALNSETFMRLLPLIRRTFSQFPVGERRQMGERAKQPLKQHITNQAVAASTANGAVQPLPLNWNRSRSEQMVPVLSLILGI